MRRKGMEVEDRMKRKERMREKKPGNNGSWMRFERKEGNEQREGKTEGMRRKRRKEGGEKDSKKRKETEREKKRNSYRERM